jgi:phage minor structural protein
VERIDILDLVYNRLAILNDNSDFSIKDDIEENLKLNEINKLSFSIPVDSEKFKYLINENLVYYKNELYIIKTPKLEHTQNDVRTCNIECYHLSSGLQSMLIEPIVSEDDTRNGIAKTATQLLTLILDGTGWSIGEVDALDTVKRSLLCDEQSVFDTLLQVAELFDLNLIFSANPSQRTVSLKKAIDSGFIIRKNKNLKNLSLQYDSSEIVTKLHVFGGQDLDTGNTISIHEAYERDAEGNIIYENGNPVLHETSYIIDYSYYLSLGYTLDYIEQHPEHFLREQTWIASEYLVADDLYVDALKKMKILAKPKVTATIDAYDMSGISEHKTHAPILSELVHIIDDDFKLILEAKIIGIKRYAKNPNLKLEISNEVEYDSMIKRLISSSEKFKKVLNPQGGIRLANDTVNGGIDTSYIKLSSTSGNWYTDNNGFLVFENPNKTQAIRMGNGNIDISNSKTPSGNYVYTSFGNGAGFNADNITKGILSSNSIKWDLVNNTFMITNPIDPNDYLLKFDGSQLYIKNNISSVTWEGIQNKPNFATVAITGNYDDLTNKPKDKHVHIQTTPSLVWTIIHDMNKFPSVTIVDSGGNEVTGKKRYVDENTVELTFSPYAFSGRAYLN